jgi:DNA-binding CsgD family transcriptional regulator
MKRSKITGVKKEKLNSQKQMDNLTKMSTLKAPGSPYQRELDRISSELAQAKVEVIHKNETLLKLKEQLELLIKNSDDINHSKHLKNIWIIVHNELEDSDNWENFSMNFDTAHNDFLKRIKMKFPDLSAKDLKLCAYLRMNMSTKEIAPLLNISIRGVEIGRYRIRKKLGLPHQQNLNEFMMTF